MGLLSGDWCDGNYVGHTFQDVWQNTHTCVRYSHPFSVDFSSTSLFFVLTKMLQQFSPFKT